MVITDHGQPIAADIDNNSVKWGCLVVLGLLVVAIARNIRYNVTTVNPHSILNVEKDANGSFCRQKSPRHLASTPRVLPPSLRAVCFEDS
eukprot:m.251764 g.251764  ORF g.251764 m.251764 type:complete len:90 (-) comp15905_c0_seq11:198-467(-)